MAHPMVAKSRMSCIERHIDNIYLNVVFQNNTQLPVNAVYNVAKTIPILDKPSNYFCTVVRMDVPLNAVPLFVIPIVPNQSNPNLTPIQFSVQASTVSVIYAPDNNVGPVPVQNELTQVVTPYYYVYSIDLLIQAFNVAIATAYTTAGSPGGAGPPFFVFNSTTQLISLIVQTAFYLAGGTLSVNNVGYNYLQGFRTVIDINSATGDNAFVIRPTGLNGFNTLGQTNLVVNNVGATGGPFVPTVLSITQEFVSMEYWVGLRKISLISASLPVNPEYIPAYDAMGGPTGVSLSRSILTDFVPEINSAGDSQSIAVYNPTAQYRLIDLIGDTPLVNISLNIYWQDKTGNYYPLQIAPLQQASVKLGFLRKDLYQNH
jgi:hypothetical protein